IVELPLKLLREPMAKPALMVFVAILLAIISVSPAAALSCYTRSSNTSPYSNGNKTTCYRGTSTCFMFNYDSRNYAGCGSCFNYVFLYSDDIPCTTCFKNYCNPRPPAVSCYHSDGKFYHSSRTKKSCTTSTCYQYSYSYGTLTLNRFFAGCGDCTRYPDTNCRSCSTDYCNSACSLGGCQFTVAAASLLALMKRL
uniref:Secreted protein n=1 Tax=Macrostomum lignano TaxID=282301 RepID=A0A1I8HQT5_9PLAT